ncbi:MAG: BA14K family protein, partial [Rhizobiales bacterium]|nr:BA14K family protein [Hyphomicrobiales bacterium]
MARRSLTATFGAAFLLGLSAQAFASAEGYCDAFARDSANRKARNSFGNVMAGSATNPVIAGASIGTAGGAQALSPDAANAKWRRAYIASYDACMFQYDGEKTVASAAPGDEVIIEEVDGQGDIPADEEAPEKPVRQAKGKPEPGTQAWNDACDRRYRSFNPKTGNYRSLSGKWRKC